MSVANQILRIKGNVSLAYTACENKGAQMPVLQNSDNLAAAINTIETKDDTLIFYDYDGSVVYEYTKDGAVALSELPPQPVHEGLISLGWAWTLSQIKNSVQAGNKLCIGGYYKTDDGKVRLYIRLEDGETDFSFTFVQPTNYNFQNQPVGVQSYASIDWGDGSPAYTTDTRTYSNSSYRRAAYLASHTYAPASYPAEYVIVITPPENVDYASSNSFGFGGYYSYYSLMNNSTAAVKKALYKIELPERISFGNYAFELCKSLCAIANSADYIFGENSLYQCKHLKAITTADGLGQYSCYLSPGLTYACIGVGKSIGNNALANCTGLKRLSGLEYAVTLGNNAFPSGARWIGETLIVPSSVTSVGQTCFGYSTFIRRVVLRTQGSIGSGAFDFSSSFLEEVDLTYYTDSSMIPTLQASFTSVFRTTNIMEDTVRFTVASEAMKTAFSNATNWSDGAAYYVVKDN